MNHRKRETVTVGLDELIPMIRESLSAGQTVELFPRGSSMRPLLREGKDAVVLSSPNTTLHVGDILLVTFADKYVLHRVIGMQRDGRYVLCGDNRFICEHGVSDKNVIAVVSGIKRDGREIRMDSFGYRAYVACITFRRRARNLLRRIRRRISQAFRHRVK
ncbi:MAG: S24/S26 family peptidase [Clostridia bacterium]|nr:S24/S26 family peptidase [Clostridia bacterium]